MKKWDSKENPAVVAMCVARFKTTALSSGASLEAPLTCMHTPSGSQTPPKLPVNSISR